MFTVAALYHFVRLDDPAALRAPLLACCRDAGVRGSVLLAGEGINGTIAGPAGGVAAVIAHLRALPGCAGLEWKESTAREWPFLRMKVRLKREIVTMGRPEADPTRAVGRHVEPGDWNALISAPDVAVIDTRNAYEVAIGSFAGAVDPRTRSFRDFPAWWEANGAQFHNKRVAMFCTGGIRCEKATSFLLAQGVEEVFHLRGGILKYLEEVPEERSLWHGACFVFDRRVAVRHGLRESGHVQCHACRSPLDPTETGHAAHEEGVRCVHCAASRSPADRARFRERARQIRLAEMRGRRHLGPRPR